MCNPNTFFGSDTNSRHSSFGDLMDNAYGSTLSKISLTSNLKIYNPSNPSCLRALGGSYIDKFLSNSSLMPIDGVATISSFSDYLAIKCEIPVGPPGDIIYHLKVNNFNKTNFEGLNKFILSGLKQQIIPLKQNLSDSECEQLAHNINQLFDTAVNKYVPTSSPNGNRTLLSSTTRALQRESKKMHRILFRN